MHNKKEKKKRNPLVCLMCEGKNNQTESNYFRNYKSRDNNFNLKIYSSEETDPYNLAKKAARLYKDNDMSKRNDDHFYCLIDLDLKESQYNAYIKAKQSFPYLEFILSNPCFEIWLLYHFTEYPKVENSSYNVKKQLKDYIKNYEESYDQYDIIQIYKKDIVAIDRSEKRNMLYGNELLYQRNPYTEVQEIIEYIKEHREQDN